MQTHSSMVAGFEFDREKVSCSSNRGFDALQTCMVQAGEVIIQPCMWPVSMGKPTS